MRAIVSLGIPGFVDGNTLLDGSRRVSEGPLLVTRSPFAEIGVVSLHAPSVLGRRYSVAL